jgi:hypothetical protein
MRPTKKQQNGFVNPLNEIFGTQANVRLLRVLHRRHQRHRRWPCASVFKSNFGLMWVRHFSRLFAKSWNDRCPDRPKFVPHKSSFPTEHTEEHRVPPKAQQLWHSRA